LGARDGDALGDAQVVIAELCVGSATQRAPHRRTVCDAQLGCNQTTLRSDGSCSICGHSPVLPSPIRWSFPEGVAVSLVVSVHDVAPASAAETLRWCADADALGIPVSLLVIPGPWRGQQLADTPDFARVLRDRRDHGDEVMMHGWTHVAGPEGSRTRRAI